MPAPAGAAGSGVLRQRAPHLLQGLALDLADALGGDAELVGQLVQRQGASVVRVAQPAGLDDPPAAGVERRQGFLDALGLEPVMLAGLDDLVGLGVRCGQPGAGRISSPVWERRPAENCLPSEGFNRMCVLSWNISVRKECFAAETGR